MKKSITIFQLGILVLALFIAQTSFSQSASWDYNVTGSSCSAIDMTGAISLGAGGDEMGYQTNWPFIFTVYNNTYLTSNVVAMNSNGFIRFDGLVSLAARYGQIPTSDAQYGQFLSYGGDTDGKTVGNVMKKLSGTAPSRILTIAFTYYTFYLGSTIYHADIQVSFYETSNEIRVRYANCGGTTNPADELGMNAGDGTYGTDIGLFPTSDTCYTFSPGSAVVVNDPTNFTATPFSSNQINLSWIKNLANNNVMIAYNTTNSFATPTNGVTYALGTQISPGQGTILYTGTGTSFNHSSLPPSTQYYYKIWSYNGTPIYSAGVDTFATTIPVADPSNFAATTFSSSQIDLSWIKNLANNNVMVAYNTTNLFATPTNGIGYIVGNQISTGQGTVIYKGSGTSYNHISLPSGTHYYKIWSYDGSTYYSNGQAANATTVSVNNPASLNATTASASQIDLAWTKNTLNQDVMIVQNSINNFATPSNAYTYWVGAGLGPNGGIVKYLGSATAYSDTALNFSTTYYYKAFSYDANHYYSIGLLDSATTLAPGISNFPYEQNFDSVSPATYSTYPSCAGSYILTEGTTFFEWQNVINDNIDFIPVIGSPYPAYSGPNGDHTSGSGVYLYATSYYNCQYQTAYLQSPIFNFTNTSNPTLQFYYHMYGSTMGTLSIQVSTNGGTTWSSNLWTKSGQQHSNASAPWSLASISLASYGTMSNIKVRFKATTGGYYSDMAIDDIRIFNSQPMVYSSSTCSQNTEPVIHGQTKQEIMKIKIVTNGDQSPISATQFTIGTAGTNSLLDITNAKIYYTGSSSNFATTNQFGGTVGSPTSSFPITGSQALVQGSNYFWLTYDIPTSAVFGNYVDACCTQITVGTSSQTPTVTCPTGNKEIKGYQTIIAGTSPTYSMPLHYYYNSACEMIYTSAEMGTAKDISKLAFYKSSGTDITHNIQNVTIYIKNSSASTLASGSYSLSGYIQVFNGAFPNNATNGWMEISLSTPFTYDGTSNVQVLVLQQKGTYFANYPNWRYGFVTVSNRCRYDNDFYDSPQNLTLLASNRLPNIRFQYELPSLMEYSHCTSAQPNTSFVKPGDANQAVIRLDVVTNNSVNPLKVKGFTLNTNGTTSLSDISNAKIYYTGSNNAFSATNQFGSTITAPGATLTFGNDSASLQGGTNYFWLSYDIKSTATFDNYIDAECSAIIVDDTSRTPIVTAPTGHRQIKPYVIVGTGTASSWRFPLAYPLYNCASEMIYLQSEFGTGAKDITKFAFEKASGANNVNSVKNVSIYMKHTTASTLSSGAYNTSTYSLVYSGSFTNNAVSGWMEVSLGFPFAYNGTQNLEVLVIQVEDTYFAGYPYWAYSTFSPNRCRTAYNNAAVPTSLTSTSDFPNTRFEYTIPTPMIYVSSEATQNDSTGVLQGGTNQMVIGIEIETNGSLTPLSATSFSINTTGTTNLGDISNAKIFYTGTDSSFSAINQFGAVPTPTSAFTITGNQTLMNGTNHFWLTYNVNSTATLGNFVDAGCTSINIGGAKTPTVTAPQGSRMISGAMSGSYTIGIGGNYPTFASAVNALGLFGISGPVQFNVISGTYNEQIVLTPVTGASATNDIIFQSQSGDSTTVILQYNNSSTNTNYTLKLDGADYITFSKMTIKALGTAYARVVEIGNNSDWNTFSNNQIVTVNSNKTNNPAGFYSYQAGGANDNHFIGNFMDINANYAFYLRGSSATVLQQNNIIESNVINNYTYGVYAYYQNNIKIKSNIITSNYAQTTNYALMMYFCDGQTQIIGNEIRLNGSSNYGIYYFNSDATSANSALIANNFINQLSGSSCYGLYIYNSNYVNAYNNNFNIISSGTSRGLYLYSGGNVNFVNNIVNCSGGGYAMYINNTAALATSDYNDLYSPGAYIGRWGTSNITTLATWKSTTNKDANSISVNPMYTSTSDLHVNNFGMDNLGTPLAIITDDIDGDIRSLTTPDIGADEFEINYDASAETITSPTTGVCSGTNNIIVTIKNNGGITLTSLTINWSINNVAQTPFSWTGSLAYGNSVNVTVGSYNFTSGNYNILVQTANPNGHTDQWTINDTTSTSVSVYGAPTVSAGIDKSICSGTNLLINTASATNYSTLNWNTTGTGTFTNGTTVSPTYTPSAADTSNGSVQLFLTSIGFAGCGNVSDTMTLILLNAPIVSFSGLDSTYCPYDPTSTLTGVPAGGTFSGSGISGNIFNHSVAGVGNHTITYTITYPVGCGGASSMNTTVYPVTNVSLTGLGTSYCANSPSVNLLVYPPNGTLTGNGISGVGVITGSNIAPLAVASASTCNTGACSTLNDLNLGTCGTQEMWITSAASNPGSSVFIQFVWPTAHTINKMTIYVGQSNTRFLTGGTIQIWNGTNWVNHTTYTQATGVCNYDINFTAVSTTRLRIINMTVGGPQSSNMNFREIEIYDVSQGGYMFNPSIAGVGNHIITYSLTEGNGCTFTDSDTATVNALPTVSFSGLASAYCSDAANVTLTGIPSGGTFSGSGMTANIFNPATAGAGTHSIFYAYQDLNGCTATDTQVVVVNALPVVSFTGFATPATYCADAGIVPLSGTPVGGTFSGNGITASNFNPATAGTGTHSITYSYTNITTGCSNSDIQSVIVNSVPIATAYSNHDSTFYNTPDTLGVTVTNGSGNYSYSWSPVTSILGSSIIQTPKTINIIYTILFTVTVTDNVTGCMDTSQVFVKPWGGPLSANATAMPDSICAGDSVQLSALASGGSGSYTYSWSSNPTGFSSTIANPIVSPLVTTTYTLTVSSGTATPVTSSVTVVVSPIPTVSFTGLASSYCADDPPATLVGSPALGIFTGNGLNGNIFDPSTVAAGTYTITYSFTNTFGCSNDTSQNTTVNAVPIAVITGPDTILYNLDTVLIGSASGGSGNYSYSWGPASAIVGSTTMQNCTTTAITFPTIFNLTVTDIVSGCTNSINKIIIPMGPGPFQALATAVPDTVCQGSSVQLNAYASGGSGIYTYLWSSNPAGFSSTLSNPITIPSITATYTITVSDGLQAATSSAIVHVIPAPVVSFIGLAANYCTNQNADTLTAIPAGGVFSGPGITANVFDPLIAGPGNHTIIYTYVDMNGCIGVDFQGTMVNNAPTANAGNDLTIPCGAPGQYIGSASVWGMTYSWTPTYGLSDSTVSNPIVSPILTTLYTVTVTDTSTGCTATDDILVFVTNPFTANAGNDTTICIGSAVILSASGGTDYKWNTGDTTTSIVVTPSVTTTYVVTVTDAGCADSDSVIVTVNNPIVNLGNDTALSYTQSIILDAGAGFVSYLWSTGDTTQTLNVDSVGTGMGSETYSVTVTDYLGCQGSDTIVITFTGIHELSNDYNVNLFPNPTKGKLIVEITGNLNEAFELNIISIHGQNVYSESIPRITGNEFTKELDLSVYPKGVYFIRLVNINSTIVRKIIVQ